MMSSFSEEELNEVAAEEMRKFLQSETIKRLERYQDRIELPKDRPARLKPRRLKRLQQSIRDFYHWNPEDLLGCFVLAIIISIITVIIESC